MRSRIFRFIDYLYNVGILLYRVCILIPTNANTNSSIHIFDTPILLLTRLLEYSYCGDLRRDLCGHIPPPLGCGTRPARGARARVLVIVYHGRGMRLYGTYKINISISSISIYEY